MRLLALTSLALLLLSACDSSSLVSPDNQTTGQLESAITIPDASRDSLAPIPTVAFNGTYQTVANESSVATDTASLGVADSDADVSSIDGAAGGAGSSSGDSRVTIGDSIPVRPPGPGNGTIPAASGWTPRGWTSTNALKYR